MAHPLGGKTAALVLLAMVWVVAAVACSSLTWQVQARWMDGSLAHHLSSFSFDITEMPSTVFNWIMGGGGGWGGDHEDDMMMASEMAVPMIAEDMDVAMAAPSSADTEDKDSRFSGSEAPQVASAVEVPVDPRGDFVPTPFFLGAGLAPPLPPDHPQPIPTRVVQGPPMKPGSSMWSINSRIISEPSPCGLWLWPPLLPLQVPLMMPP